MTHNLLMRFIYKPRCEEDLMDGVYRVVDSWLRRGMFDKADNLLRDLELSRMSTLGMVGVLGITRTARELLPNYDRFCSDVRHHLTKIEPSRVDGILLGLE